MNYRWTWILTFSTHKIHNKSLEDWMRLVESQYVRCLHSRSRGEESPGSSRQNIPGWKYFDKLFTRYSPLFSSVLLRLLVEIKVLFFWPAYLTGQDSGARTARHAGCHGRASGKNTVLRQSSFASLNKYRLGSSLGQTE